MTTWRDVPAVSDVTIRELGRNLPVVARGGASCLQETVAPADSAEQSARQMKKALNGTGVKTWEAVDVLEAEYRVGQAVVRNTSQFPSQESQCCPLRASAGSVNAKFLEQTPCQEPIRFGAEMPEA